jgi:hypothetical protein
MELMASRVKQSMNVVGIDFKLIASSNQAGPSNCLGTQNHFTIMFVLRSSSTLVLSMLTGFWQKPMTGDTFSAE